MKQVLIISCLFTLGMSVMAHGAPPKSETVNVVENHHFTIEVSPVSIAYEAVEAFEIVNHVYTIQVVTDKFAAVLPPELFWRTRPMYLGKDLHYAGNDLIKNKSLGWKMTYPIKLC